MLGVSPATVNRWAAAGRVAPAVELPGRTGARLFLRSDVESLRSETDRAGSHATRPAQPHAAPARPGGVADPRRTPVPGAGTGVRDRDRGGCVVTPAEAATRLRSRADRYSRDAGALRECGDVAMCVAYQAVADELRAVADEMGARLADAIWATSGPSTPAIGGTP